MMPAGAPARRGRFGRRRGRRRSGDNITRRCRGGGRCRHRYGRRRPAPASRRGRSSFDARGLACAFALTMPFLPSASRRSAPPPERARASTFGQRSRQGHATASLAGAPVDGVPRLRRRRTTRRRQTRVGAARLPSGRRWMQDCYPAGTACARGRPPRNNRAAAAAKSPRPAARGATPAHNRGRGRRPIIAASTCWQRAIGHRRTRPPGAPDR